ncbi:MAG: [protein-PII] uridylyltransferase family protein, partial [Planctomycetota bacterium]
MPLSESDVRSLLERPGGRRAAMLLAGCGFAVPRKAAAALASLVEAGGGAEALTPGLTGLLADVAETADPDAALDGLAGLAAAAGKEGGPALLSRLAGDSAGRRALLGLLSSSRAFTATLIRWPDWVEEVLAPGEIESAHSAESLSAELRLAALRRFRRRHVLGIAARDTAGRADLAATTAEISAVADAVVAGALLAARAETGADSVRLAVLGLGKLGGGELNYSSDIDLIFLTDSPGGEPQRLAEETVRALSEPTADGTAYRVDMRLRPEGSTGALVWDLDAALGYYRSRARPWERQALVKCRPVAGDLELGRAFLDGLEGFIWQSGLGPAEVARACELRSEMEQAAAASAGGGQEVKSGTGGIRDVEFAVQILQLAHGAEHPELRCAGTLPAIDALERAGLLDADRARRLRSGYEFLRRTEHCLQTMDELALHAVPAGATERAGLARRLGYGGSPEAAGRSFEADLRQHSAALRNIYEEVCGQGASGSDLAGRLAEVLAEDDDAELVSLLSVLGFGEGRHSAAVVRAMAGRTPRGAEALAPVLEELRRGVGPDRGLANLESVIDSELLERTGSDAALREALLGICASSDFLSGLIAARRECVELILPGENGRARRGRERLAADLRDFVAGAGSGDDLAAALASFRERELIRVGARDLLDGEPPAEVSDELGFLAELEMGAAFSAAELPGEVVVLALGRLGGGEMSYGSDLDLVFVDSGAAADPSRAVQEATRVLTAAGYEIDTRLRPAGSSGQLVASLSRYRSYRDRGELAAWERLALVRARPVHGSDSARAAVHSFLEETLYGAEPPATLAADTWSMRLRLERTAEQADFKRGSGGLVDLEFLAEYLALAHGQRRKALRSRGVEETFEAAAAEGVLPRAEASKALDAHRFLRRLEMRARVVVGRAVRSLPADETELSRLARMIGEGGGSPEELRSAFERHTAEA